MSRQKLVLESPLCWPGGKHRLATAIVRRIPPHRIYVEPFLGAGHVFWSKEPAEIAVINDIDRDLIRWYRQLKRLPSFKCDMTPDQDKFERLVRKRGPRSFCEFLIVTKHSYGCKQRTYNYGSVRRCLNRRDPEECGIVALKRKFPEYKDRLRTVVILNEDFRKAMRRYDGPDTFFYLDPPFHEKACEYNHCDVKPKDVADAVRNLKGKFLLSYNDHPEVRAAFRGYKIEVVSTVYELQKSVTHKTKKVRELLIMNYKPPKS